ncbi:MAG TPA: protein kinase [Polyangiaceae bacterium]|nr:protein kinase [Polyangiaceae bacterium]
MDLEIGQVFVDRYFVNRLVGRGSSGQVYEARDSARGGRVAIRILEARIDHGAVFNEREAAAAGRLSNPHLTEFVRVEPLPNSELCVVSQFIEGESLERKMQRWRRMTPFGLSQLLIQLLDGLAAAHRAGIIHRDLTPRSIFLGSTKPGVPPSFKLIDFGLSRFDLLKADRAGVSLDRERDSLQYLSPEQLGGVAEPDGRSNLYSLGVIAYRAITGRLPFQAPDFVTLLSNASQQDAALFDALADLASHPLAQLIRKTMAPSPSARFQSAEEMLAAVGAFATDLGAPADDGVVSDAQYFESALVAPLSDGDSEMRGQKRAELVSTVRAAQGFPADAVEPNSEPQGARAHTDARAAIAPVDAHSSELEPSSIRPAPVRPGASEPLPPARVPPVSSESEPTPTQAASSPTSSIESESPSADAGEHPRSPASFRLRQSTVPGIQPISAPTHEVPVALGSSAEVDAPSATAPRSPQGGEVPKSPGQTGTSGAAAIVSTPAQGANANVGTAKASASSAPTQGSAVGGPKELKLAPLPLTTALPRTTDQARAAAAQRAARRSASVRPPAESPRVVVAASEQPQPPEIEPEAREERPSQSRKQVFVALALALLAGGGVLVAWLYGRSTDDPTSAAATDRRAQPSATAAITSGTLSVTESAAASVASTSGPSAVETTPNTPPASSPGAPPQAKAQSAARAVTGTKRSPSAVTPTKKSGASRRDSAKDPYNYR